MICQVSVPWPHFLYRFFLDMHQMLWDIHLDILRLNFVPKSNGFITDNLFTIVPVKVLNHCSAWEIFCDGIKFWRNFFGRWSRKECIFQHFLFSYNLLLSLKSKLFVIVSDISRLIASCIPTLQKIIYIGPVFSFTT